jgi:hypothetical protein
MSGVVVGQVWECLDPRTPGRRFVVLQINEKLGYADVKKDNGKFGRVKLHRFKPWTNGYKLINGGGGHGSNSEVVQHQAV